MFFPCQPFMAKLLRKTSYRISRLTVQFHWINYSFKEQELQNLHQSFEVLRQKLDLAPQ